METSEARHIYLLHSEPSFFLHTISYLDFVLSLPISSELHKILKNTNFAFPNNNTNSCNKGLNNKLGTMSEYIAARASGTIARDSSPRHIRKAICAISLSAAVFAYAPQAMGVVYVSMLFFSAIFSLGCIIASVALNRPRMKNSRMLAFLSQHKRTESSSIFYKCVTSYILGKFSNGVSMLRSMHRAF
jgi:hypothetical protein